MMTKTAHAKLAAELAPIEERDRNNAFELGFAKIAQELKLDEATYHEFRKTAIELQKQK